MGRNTQVKQADFSDVMDQVDELLTDLHALNDGLRKNLGWADDVTTPLAYARTFSALAEASANVSHAILIKLAMEEDRAALEKVIRARVESAS